MKSSSPSVNSGIQAIDIRTEAQHWVEPESLSAQAMLEITCDDGKQILHRPLPEGADPSEFQGPLDVCFVGDLDEVPAFKAEEELLAHCAAIGEAEDDLLVADGKCHGVVYIMTGLTLTGNELSLGHFFSEADVDRAKVALSTPVQALRDAGLLPQPDCIDVAPDL